MGKYSLKKKENSISEETANAQIMILLERYEIDLDVMEDDKKEALTQAVDHIVKRIMAGWLEIFEENGEVKIKQRLQNTTEKTTITELVYRECNGRMHKAMGTKGNIQTQMLSLMAAMCETNGGSAAIEQLRSSDLTSLEFLSMLFLAH